VESFCCEGAGCVNLAADVQHCGGCDVTCEDGEICVAGDGCGLGRCECPGMSGGCGEGEVCCPDVGCVDLEHDVRNCGACGNDCLIGDANGPRGDLCDAGRCYCDRAGTVCSLTTWCTAVTEPDGEDCGCMDLDHDESNCGACGRRCDENEVCDDGVCLCEASRRACAASETCCPGDGCVNQSTDPENCGDCGLSCGADETCSGGHCLCGGAVCDGGQNCCAGSCHWGTCCFDDDDCWGASNPDCNGTNHSCYCRPAGESCRDGKVCCHDGCKQHC
jgi:hypothetical protein